MSRSTRMYLEDILEACRKIDRFTDGLSRKEFEGDELKFDAVIRNLEVIGEAAKHVPEELRVALSGIAWKRISGFRDILAHEYFGVDEDILWDVLTSKVPEVRSVIEAYLRNIDGSPES